MDSHIVNNKAELEAALRAAAQPTHEKARANPCTIELGACVYRFPEGLHEKRALQICRALKRMPAAAFNTTRRQVELV